MAVEIHKSFPIVEIFATTSAAGSTLLWGNISGVLANQTDLQAALDLKAPATPQFLTLATHSGISNERVFTPSADFTPVDGGAGNTYTLALAVQGGLTPGTYNTFTVNNKGIITAASSVPSISPITTRGDVIIGDSSGSAIRLPIGTATYVLTSDGTDVNWAAPSGGSGGDMLLGTAQTVTAAKTFLDGTLLMRNVANTFSSYFTNTNSAARAYTLPDATGTLALTSDLTGYITLGGAQTLTSDKTLNTGTNYFVIQNASTEFKVDPTNGLFKISTTGMGTISAAISASAFTTVGAGGYIFNSGGDFIFDANTGANNNVFSGKITVNNGTGRAGINIGDFSATPATVVRADIWYNSTDDNFYGRHDASTNPFATTDSTQVFTNKTLTSPTINVGSDATGDMYQRNGTTFARLAGVSAGSFLRSGGVGAISAWSTVKLPTTMSALGLWVANSANTAVNLTAAANQSIRVNAGGTAWEAYTPSGGGGWALTGTTTLTGNVLIDSDDNDVDFTTGTGDFSVISSGAIYLEATGGTDMTLLGDGSNINITGFGSNIILDASQIYATHNDGFYLPASTTGVASLNVPHGVAPTTPVNGDVWTTTTSMYARINGVTVDLTTGGSSTLAGLTDVDLTSPLTTQFLQYNGSDWVNAYFSNPVSTPSIVANAYTLQATDQNKILHINNGSTNCTITLPDGLATNFSCTLVHKGTGGIITLVATTTLESYGTTIEIPEVGATVYHQGSNIWTALGALGAGGGGSSYTFTNGLTESGGTVSLGGTLTGNTTIHGSGSAFNFLFDEIGSFQVNASAINLNFNSSAAGDLYRRNSGNTAQERIAAGTDTHVLTMVSGMPSWAAPSGGGGTWGSITGTLSSQTDLQSALDAKLNLTGATYTTTTGNGLDITSSTVTSGNLVSITNTGTAAASDTKTALYVASSGANGTSGEDTYAARFSNTGTGTTSTNVGIETGASGGTSNFALRINAGDVRFNQSATQTISKTGGVFSIGTADFSTLSLIVTGTSRLSINGTSGQFTFATNTATSGAVIPYLFTDSNRTNQTASTETNFMRWTPESTQYATGSQTILRTYRMNAATYSFVGASVIDDAYGLWVASPIASTNATITNNWAAGFNGNVQVDGNLSVTGNLTGTVKISDAPTQDNAATQILTRNISTGAIEYKDATVGFASSAMGVEDVPFNHGVLSSTNTSSTSIHVNAYYANKTSIYVEVKLVAVKTDGTASASATVSGRFRKDNSGTFNLDENGTVVTSDAAIIADLDLEINGTNPSVKVTMGAASGDYEVSHVAKTIWTTN